MVKISAILRSDNGGLGTLSRLFDAGLPIYKRLAINRIPNERGDFCREQDERTRLQDGAITVADIHWLCDGADVLLSAETFYEPSIPRLAKQMGVRVAFVPMYELLPTAAEWMDYVDVVISPTDLDLHVARDETPGLAHARHVMAPIPTDCERIPFKLRERAEVFIHRAGHQGEGRNGSIEVLNAWQHVKSPARLIVYHQGELPCAVPSDYRIECRNVNPPNYWDQYADGVGQVMIHPTRWDALSLPIQEALTAGMPVICSKWWPHCDDGERNGYLPPWCQAHAIPVARTLRRRLCREFTAHFVTAPAIAEMVDQMYGTDISAASREAREWAESRSWDRLRETWLEALT